jgi:hypothetical protein
VALALRLVLPAMLVSSVAIADRVSSYGYVTHVAFPNANAEVNTHGCIYDVALPKTLLDHAPEGPHPELLKGATQAFGADDDTEGTCDEIEHTWQRVTFDPRHRDHVTIAMPAETRFNFTAWFVTVAAALLLLPAVFGRSFGRWYWGRRQRRSERLARKLQKIRERIQNEPPAPLSRAEVVERGDPSEE